MGTSASLATVEVGIIVRIQAGVLFGSGSLYRLADSSGGSRGAIQERGRPDDRRGFAAIGPHLRSRRGVAYDHEGMRMEGNRFDNLTRTLASTKTRRGFIGTLAALGAGLTGARGVEGQSHASCGNVLCWSNPGVRAAGCVCCGYSNGNSRCRPASQCTGPGSVIPTTGNTTMSTTAKGGD